MLCKLLLTIPSIGQHCLIYWVGEDSVTPMPVSSVRNCVLGEVGIADGKYAGKVIGLGKSGNTAAYITVYKALKI